MRPCFTALREHLKDLLNPLQQANFKVRFGLVAYAAAPGRGGPVYDHTFIGGSGPEMVRKLYSASPNAADFFTSDSSVVTRVLGGLEAQGNEDTLLALDIAADFPFGPPESTRRVIAVFTDEPLEAGVSGADPVAKIPELIQKLMSRRIQLFVSAPFSPAMEQLGSLDRAEIEAVDGGDGLKSVDFKKLLAQMGKSISVSSLQIGAEPAWKKAVFGQDRWNTNRSITEASRRVVLSVGESICLDATRPIRNLRVKMIWSKGDTFLDIYAIYRTRVSMKTRYVGWINRENEDGIFLSEDPDLSKKTKTFDMTIDALGTFADILIAANIYNAGDEATWADYDGQVVVETDAGEAITTHLTAQEPGPWCVIARIDNHQSESPRVVNVNQVFDDKPDMEEFS
jgi:hypothetical protein